MTNRNDWLEDLQRNMSELIAKSPAGDIERNVRAMLAQGFSRLDLVTREEFDIQKDMLERALVRIAALEARVSALEAGASGDPAASFTPSPATPDSSAHFSGTQGAPDEAGGHEG